MDDISKAGGPDRDSRDESLRMLGSLMENVQEIKASLEGELRELQTERTDVYNRSLRTKKQSRETRKGFKLELERIDCDLATLSKNVEIQTHKHLLLLICRRNISQIGNAKKDTSLDVRAMIDDVNDDPKLLQLQLDIAQLQKRSSDLRRSHAKIYLDEARMKSNLNGIAQTALTELAKFVQNAGNQDSTTNPALAALDNLKSVESRNIGCFISRFYACSGVNTSMSDVAAYESAHLKTCKTKHLACYTTSMLSIRDFISEMTHHLKLEYTESKESTDSEELVEEEDSLARQIEIKLEDKIFPQIYSVAKMTVNAPVQDRKLSDKCATYHDATQIHFGISPEFYSNELAPYSLPIATLRSMYLALTPTRKALKILEAIQGIFDQMEELSPNSHPSIEDFLPIWLYCVCKARIHEIRTSLAYIYEYSSEETLQSDLGYAVNSLDRASNHLASLTDDQLHNYEKDRTIRPIFALEKKRFKEWSQAEITLDVINEGVTITGYRLYCVDEWVWNPIHFYSAVAVRTGNESDEIRASICCFNNLISSAQKSFVEGIFVYPQNVEWIESVKAKGSGIESEIYDGNLLVFDKEAFDEATKSGKLSSNGEEKLNLSQVKGGDFDGMYPSLRIQLNAKYLFCNTLELQLDLIDETNSRLCNILFRIFCGIYKQPFVAENEFSSLFSVQQIDETVCSFVQNVQTMLQIIDLFPILVEKDGEFSHITRSAVVLFQRKFNEFGFTLVKVDRRQPNATFSLIEDGTMDVATFTMLKLAIHQIQALLVLSGAEGCPADPTVGSQETEFHDSVKKFQVECGLYADGRVGAKTLKKLYAVCMKLNPGFIAGFCDTFDEVVDELMNSEAVEGFSASDGGRSAQELYVNTYLHENGLGTPDLEAMHEETYEEVNEVSATEDAVEAAAEKEVKLAMQTSDEFLEVIREDITSEEIAELAKFEGIAERELLAMIWDGVYLARLTKFISAEVMFSATIEEASMAEGGPVAFVLEEWKKEKNMAILSNAVRLLSLHFAIDGGQNLGRLLWALVVEKFAEESPIERTNNAVSLDIVDFFRSIQHHTSKFTELRKLLFETPLEESELLVEMVSYFNVGLPLKSSQDVLEYAQTQNILFAGMEKRNERDQCVYLLSLMSHFHERSVRQKAAGPPAEYECINAMLNCELDIGNRNLAEAMKGSPSDVLLLLLDAVAGVEVAFDEMSSLAEAEKTDKMIGLANAAGIPLPRSLKSRLLSKDIKAFALSVELVFRKVSYERLGRLYGIADEDELISWCNKKTEIYGVQVRNLQDSRLKNSQFLYALASSLFPGDIDMSRANIGVTDHQRSQNAKNLCSLLWGLNVKHLVHPDGIIEMSSFIMLQLIADMIQ